MADERKATRRGIRDVPWWMPVVAGTVLHFVVWAAAMSVAFDGLPPLLGSVLFDAGRLLVLLMLGLGWYLLFRRRLSGLPSGLLALGLALLHAYAMAAAAFILFFPKI